MHGYNVEKISELIKWDKTCYKYGTWSYIELLIVVCLRSDIGNTTMLKNMFAVFLKNKFSID